MLGQWLPGTQHEGVPGCRVEATPLHSPLCLQVTSSWAARAPKAILRPAQVSIRVGQSSWDRQGGRAKLSRWQRGFRRAIGFGDSGNNRCEVPASSCILSDYHHHSQILPWGLPITHHPPHHVAHAPGH